MRCFAGTLDDAVESVIDRVLSRLGGLRGPLQRARTDGRAGASPTSTVPSTTPGSCFRTGRRSPGCSAGSAFRAAERVGGPDLMLGVLDRGRARELRHVFLGSTDPTLQCLSERIRAQLRGVEIVGTLAPPFDDANEWSDEAIAQIRAWRPDIIWLALGAPKQEVWMRKHAAAVAPAVVLGVGAAFDFHAATKARAPEWMQHAGLEWAHRLRAEPKRLARRYMTTNSAFMARAILLLTRRAFPNRRKTAATGAGRR